VGVCVWGGGGDKLGRVGLGGCWTAGAVAGSRAITVNSLRCPSVAAATATVRLKSCNAALLLSWLE
jgi:hypothetical protein